MRLYEIVSIVTWSFLTNIFTNNFPIQHKLCIYKDLRYLDFFYSNKIKCGPTGGLVLQNLERKIAYFIGLNGFLVITFDSDVQMTSNFHYRDSLIIRFYLDSA